MIRCDGRARPIPAKAPRTRSRLSATALSGRPTMVKIVCWFWPTSCTSTSTRRASTPSKATVTTRATMRSSLSQEERTMNPDRLQERRYAARLASIASHVRAAASTPEKRFSCWAPVGEVTLISVR